MHTATRTVVKTSTYTKNDVLQRLAHLRTLKRGWMGSDEGSPMDESVLRDVALVAEQLSALGHGYPSVHPRESGGVQLEWAENGWAITYDMDRDGAGYLQAINLTTHDEAYDAVVTVRTDLNPKCIRILNRVLATI